MWTWLVIDVNSILGKHISVRIEGALIVQCPFLDRIKSQTGWNANTYVFLHHFILVDTGCINVTSWLPICLTETLKALFLSTCPWYSLSNMVMWKYIHVKFLELKSAPTRWYKNTAITLWMRLASLIPSLMVLGYIRAYTMLMAMVWWRHDMETLSG